jgi:negative regulator of sigma-B (phosphoserine phosphatase)
MTGGAHDGPLLACGWAGSALEHESGDLHVVAGFPGGALVALIDGLGHGPEAALAASAAARVLVAHPAEPVIELVQRCHGELRKTRGAVMSVASFPAMESRMTWLAVGNVEAVLFRASGARAEGIASRGGVVGYQLPPLRSATLAVAPGDTLILASDGIRSGFIVDLALEPDPQHIADDLLARFARGSDDAHVVVARYLGAAP